jgi:TATA-box binding protein (TBP) (component of TFIID and TFIIIB)
MNLDLQHTADRLGKLDEGQVEANPFLVSFTTGGHRMVIFQDGRVLVHGTKDTAEARTLVHRYFG